MIDTSTLGHPTGGLGHLRLHAPVEVDCPYRTSAKIDFRLLSPLNVAFQQATGWELNIRESESSYKKRLEANEPMMPAVPNLTISDLSSLLPPGIPAVSRIYCEFLIDEFNQVLDELGERKQTEFLDVGRADLDGPGHSSKIQDSHIKTSFNSIQSGAEVQLPVGVGLFTERFAIQPLLPSGNDSTVATTDWCVLENGSVRFFGLARSQGSGTLASELLIARTTFLNECRHLTGVSETCNAIESTIERLFERPDDQSLLVGEFDPVLGDLELSDSGDGIIHSTSPGFQPGRISKRQHVHLASRQHVVATLWPANACEDELIEWVSRTIDLLRAVDPESVCGIVDSQLNSSLPRLPIKPGIAISLSRR